MSCDCDVTCLFIVTKKKKKKKSRKIDKKKKKNVSVKVFHNKVEGKGDRILRSSDWTRGN